MRLLSLPISRATSARTIVALVSGMIVVLVGIAGWFLYQAASDFNVVQGVADRRLALRQEQSKSEALTGALATARQENESQATALKRANDRPDNSKQLAETQQALRQEQSKSEALTARSGNCATGERDPGSGAQEGERQARQQQATRRDPAGAAAGAVEVRGSDARSGDRAAGEREPGDGAQDSK